MSEEKYELNKVCGHYNCKLSEHQDLGDLLHILIHAIEDLDATLDSIRSYGINQGAD